MSETELKIEEPVFIQPRKLANKNGELRYTWKVEDFKRLDGLLFSNEGEIKVHLTGRVDNRHRSLVEAHITANIQLECQTSFEAIDYQVDTTVLYCSIIKEEQIETLDDDYEPLLVDDGLVDIRQVIQDELILSLPLAVNKANEELGIKMSYGELPEVDGLSEDAEEKKNPFSALEGLNINKS